MLLTDQISITSQAEAALVTLGRIRVDGGLHLGFEAGPVGTVCRDIREADGYRARFPRGPHCEAVILNTGGGIAGGDCVTFAIDMKEASCAAVTSIAAERIYRTRAEPARLSHRFKLNAGAHLFWLPEETLLHSGARLDRVIEVDLAADSSLTLADIVVLGRIGSGETMSGGMLTDRWSVRRAGRLIHREALRLNGEIADHLARNAVATGAHVIGTLLHVGPDASEKLGIIRAVLDRTRALASSGSGMQIAASSWDGRLVIRALSRDAGTIRTAFARMLVALAPARIPRSWASSAVDIDLTTGTGIPE